MKTPTIQAIPIELPEGIPAPKLKLFQSFPLGDELATIIGIEYIDPMTALVDRYDDYGWMYMVSLVYHLNHAQAVERGVHRDATQLLWEKELEGKAA